MTDWDFSPDDSMETVARLSFREESYALPRTLRYDLENASTLLAGFVWLGATDATAPFRRIEWESELRVTRIHYGSPFQLDVTTVGVRGPLRRGPRVRRNSTQ